MTTAHSPRREILLGALLPAFIFSLGAGAMIPVLAPFAVERGASLAVAGIIAAMLPVGQILADLPAGALAARVGDRRAMLLAAGAAAIGFLAAGLAPSLLTLGAAVGLVGAANAVFHLARHSYLTEVTPVHQRARVLSTLGGVHRIGQFLGPFLGAGVLLLGDLRAVFLLALLTAVAAGVTVLLAPEIDTRPARAPGASRAGFTQVIARHRELLLTLGVASMLVGAIRGARQQVLPLWGEHIGLDPTTISLLFGLAGGIDMLLFYPAGKIMDRFGRLWIGVPSMTCLGVAMALVPLAHSVPVLAAVAVLLGVSNGLGSGVMMTIASDIAPADARPQFLGAWRLMQDLGIAAGPLTLAAGAALGSLAAGVWVAAAMGPLASAGLLRWLPRYSVHASRRTRRAAGID
ncbi:MFS transporter [Nesterenkonia jeotgali]|uniref:MFS family permease n=1 Tax=Nesterenkonia jeotgali TaxID=317018 RepID=A0A0W8IDD8_9MICC|nr:MFS transporter [Nesterenkonia jeotgali]KUG57955.1 transporter [Nesterenkonia jeotgali]MBA8920712.1 MFS family permease [Nesterenkonia jeotgali]